jgi:hypothetical protein
MVTGNFGRPSLTTHYGEDCDFVNPGLRHREDGRRRRGCRDTVDAGDRCQGHAGLHGSGAGSRSVSPGGLQEQWHPRTAREDRSCLQAIWAWTFHVSQDYKRVASRHPEPLTELVDHLGKAASAGTPRDAAEFVDVVLLTVPLRAVPDLASDVRPMLSGKVVLDTGNAYERRDGDIARQASEHPADFAGWAAEIGACQADALSDPRDPCGYSASDLITMGFIATPSCGALARETRPAADIDVDRFDAILVASVWTVADVHVRCSRGSSEQVRGVLRTWETCGRPAPWRGPSQRRSAVQRRPSCKGQSCHGVRER